MKLPRPTAATLAALLAGVAILSGCENPRADNAAREGLPETIEEIEYNVYITRELNLRDIEDKGYVQEIDEAPPGFALYGVFLEACNLADEGGEEIMTADEFFIEDTQGNRFQPLPLEEENIFGYKAEALGGQDCIPEEGTLARSSPTNGSLLVFELPLETLENRPLQLIITGPGGDEGRVELDI